MDDLKEFINTIVTKIVDNPEQIQISERDGEQAIIFELRVDKKDFGKVIGKKGRNAESIRTLLTAVSAKIGKRAILEVVES